MSLTRLDLNLLVALDALLQERSVSRAAERMGLSQPAVSAQLGKLRRHFDDDLLVRVGNSYRLSPLAAHLRERVRVAVSGVERVFAAEPHFTPATTTREFSMVVSDYGMAVLGPAVAGLLAAEAPTARIRFIDNPPQVIDSVRQTLTNIDGVVLPRGFVTDMPHHELYRDEWVCLVSVDNQEVGDTLTVRQLQTLPWVITYHGHPPTSTLAARRMRMLGIEPRVQVVTETFLGVPRLVSGSNRVALLPRRLTERIPAQLGVRALPSPFDGGPLIEVLSWHPMYDDDPEHQYFRDVVVRAAGEISAVDGVA